jgi:hypothetical protein
VTVLWSSVIVALLDNVAYCVLTEVTVETGQVELEVMIGEMVPTLVLVVEFMLTKLVEFMLVVMLG